MTFEIKLKAGFFKTQQYFLTIGRKHINLTPQNAANDSFLIDDNELIAIGIFKKNRQTAEIEIITSSSVYTGAFSLRKNLEEVCLALVKEFGNILFVND